MSQNSVTSPPPQGPVNQASIDFLESFRSVDTVRLWIAASIPVSGKIENGGYYSRAAVAAMDPGERHHFSCGVFLPAKTTHRVEYATEFPFVFFDDVGKLPANFRPGIDKSVHGNLIDSDEFFFMPTSWVTETSAHNHQYGYQIKPAMTLYQAKLVNMALKLDQRFAESAKDLSVIQYARLPTGHNSKANKGNFPTRLVSRDPDVTYTFDEFVKGFHLDIDAAAAVLAPKKAVASAEKCSVETMKAILDAMPNTFSRPDWTGICHAIQNTLGEDGRDVWVEWSETYKKPGDPTHVVKSGEAEHVWETLPAGHKNDLGSLRKILIDLHGEDSDVVRTIKGRISNEQSGGFTTIDPADIPASPAVSPDERKKADAEIDRLLAEIAKRQPVPAKHREPAGGLHGVFDLIAKTQVDPPVILAPYTRGKLAVLAGSPARGKSLMLEQECVAIAAGRHDLIRYGDERIMLPGDIIYFSNEDGVSVFTQRAKGFAQRHNITKGKYDVFPVVSHLMKRDGDRLAYACVGILKDVLAHIETGRDVAMIVVDTLPASVTGFEENSATEMTYVLQFLKKLADSFWAAVVFIHHGNKQSWSGEDRSLAGLRGSGAIAGFVRGAVLVVPPDAKEAAAFPPDLVAEGKIVIEWVNKASNGRQNYQACAYKLTLETIDVEDAEQDGVMIRREVPVLEPIRPATTAAMAFHNEMELDGYRIAVETRLDKGEEVRRYKATTRSHDAHGVHVIWGVHPKKAWNVMDVMVSRGWFSLKPVKDGHAEVVFEVISKGEETIF